MRPVTSSPRAGGAEILYRNDKSNSREERYANSFGRALLTPARAVMQKFEEVTAGSNKASRRHIIVLAHYFGVAREAIVRRLEELSLVRPETWDWFQANGGITDEQARQVLGDLAVPDVAKGRSRSADNSAPEPPRSGSRQTGVLSEGQLARLLRVDRIELRDILTNEELEGSEGDGVIDRVD